NTYKKGISHVGIYIGDGQFVHAASSRHSVVVDKLDATYFSSRFAGGRRIVTDAMRPPVLGAVGDQLEALREAHDPKGESH
ncbi:MAG TPA: NlpC/P60 family protein, partial [Thermoanaerobaculia bacterium]|nr:NlpC/P60 family protein [Thermoanaerobaculia bacterium]